MVVTVPIEMEFTRIGHDESLTYEFEVESEASYEEIERRGAHFVVSDGLLTEEEMQTEYRVVSVTKGLEELNRRIWNTLAVDEDEINELRDKIDGQTETVTIDGWDREPEEITLVLPIELANEFTEWLAEQVAEYEAEDMARNNGAVMTEEEYIQEVIIEMVFLFAEHGDMDPVLRFDRTNPFVHQGFVKTSMEWGDTAQPI